MGWGREEPLVCLIEAVSAIRTNVQRLRQTACSQATRRATYPFAPTSVKQNTRNTLKLRSLLIDGQSGVEFMVEKITPFQVIPFLGDIAWMSRHVACRHHCPCMLNNRINPLLN